MELGSSLNDTSSSTLSILRGLESSLSFNDYGFVASHMDYSACHARLCSKQSTLLSVIGQL